jgi:excisionase family DNA binding protein
MEYSSKEILKLIERASGIPDILAKRETIEELLEKFTAVEEYLRRFQTLEELTLHLKEVEDKIYLCKEYLTTEEACKYLSLSKYTLREVVKRREIPFYTPPGKGYYFLRTELDEWVLGFRVPSASEAEEQARMEQRADLAAKNKGHRHEK